MSSQDNNGFRVLEQTLAAMGVAKSTPYSLLKRGSRVLCALPGNKDVALRTLGLYQPQRLKARLAAELIRVGVRSGLYTKFLEQWSAPLGNGTDGESDVGVLVGSEGHLCDRAVVVGLGEDGWQVTKVAYGEKGREILDHEAEMLAALEGRFDGAPRLSGIVTRAGVTMLTMPWSQGRAWNGEVYELLPILDGWKVAHPPERLDSFAEWAAIHPVIANHPVLYEKLQGLEAKMFQPTIRHGDMTRPNIRLDSGGDLVIHDWERGSMHGIPGLDLVFFLYQDRQFRSDEAPSRSLHQVELELMAGDCAEWLEHAGWKGHVRELMILTFALTTGCGFFDHRSLLELLARDMA